ncbi:hypothetical protein MYX82_01220 [Acidobacteria bacterium AH-259-D05]|nr:hypothetical protein [Acidobacteria bacterium AH-259-D05]
MQYRKPSDFWIVTYGWRDLFGKDGSVEEMVGRLRRYSLGEVLQALGRISTILNRLNKGLDQIEDQRHICQKVFRERAEAVWRAFGEQIKKDEPPAAALFYEVQVINAAKLALLTLDIDGSLDERKSLADLGDALLMLTDVVNAQSAPSTELEGRGNDVPEDWQEFFLRNRLFHRGGHWLSNLARSYDLYCTNRENLKKCDSYVDLPGTIRQVTGLSPDDLWVRLFVLVSHWNQADLEKGWVNGRLNIEQYFSAMAVDPEQFLQPVLGQAAQVRHEVRQRYPISDLQPYHYLPLAKCPVVRIEDDCYCVSAKLLTEKLSVGFYHLFLGSPWLDESARQRFLNYHGQIVQDYVDRLLFRLYPRQSGRYLDENTLKPFLGDGKRADGLILYGDAAIILETKGTLYTLEVRSTGDWEAFQKKATDIFLESAEQIDATIRGIQAGRLKSLGIDPCQIRSYYPLIVTLEDTGIMAPTYRFLAKLIEEKEWLCDPSIRCFQNIAVAELDQMETDVLAGKSLLDLIKGKVLSTDWREDSFANYCHAEARDWMNEPSPYLKHVGKDLMDRGLKYIKDRKKSTTGAEKH